MLTAEWSAKTNGSNGRTTTELGRELTIITNDKTSVDVAGQRSVANLNTATESGFDTVPVELAADVESGVDVGVIANLGIEKVKNQCRLILFLSIRHKIAQLPRPSQWS